QGPHHQGKPKLPIKIIFLKRSPLKWLKRRRPKAEFIIGAPCIGIRPIEPGIGPRWIGIGAIERGVKTPRVPIRDTELLWPVICAVAVEAAKTHAATQPRRTNFLQFIAYRFLKIESPGIRKLRHCKR